MQSLLTISKARRARLEVGLSLLELQLRTGVNVSKLSTAERGLTQLTRAERRAVAAALGADPDALYDSGSEQVA